MDISGKLGQKLLQGWTMLGDTCPNCPQVPLMKSKQGILMCVNCDFSSESSTPKSSSVTQVPATQAAKEPLFKPVEFTSSRNVPVASVEVSDYPAELRVLLNLFKQLGAVSDRFCASNSRNDLALMRGLLDSLEVFCSVDQVKLNVVRHVSKWSEFTEIRSELGAKLLSKLDSISSQSNASAEELEIICNLSTIWSRLLKLKFAYEK